MIERKSVVCHTEAEVARICDKCGRRSEAGSDFEYDEFICIRTTGGYGSVLGDCARIEVDLCQHCVKDILGSYLRVTQQGM